MLFFEAIEAIVKFDKSVPDHALTICLEVDFS